MLNNTWDIVMRIRHVTYERYIYGCALDVTLLPASPESLQPFCLSLLTKATLKKRIYVRLEPKNGTKRMQEKPGGIS